MKLEEIIQLIKDSTLHPRLKEGIYDRYLMYFGLYFSDKKIEEEEIEEEQTIYCESDSCRIFYEEIMGRSIYDENDKERADVDPTIQKHFKENLKDFPFDICTEDYFPLYYAKR